MTETNSEPKRNLFTADNIIGYILLIILITLCSYAYYDGKFISNHIVIIEVCEGQLATYSDFDTKCNPTQCYRKDDWPSIQQSDQFRQVYTDIQKKLG